MKKQPCYIHLLVLLLVSTGVSSAQKSAYTHADSLKGNYSKERSWWNVLHYDLHVDFNFNDSSIAGYNKILYKVIENHNLLQLDLMQPMQIDSIVQNNKPCSYRRDGDAYFVKPVSEQIVNSMQSLLVYFHGKPKAAKNPPWDGGIIWSKDRNNNPWMSIACQGMAARVWFPNKDHMADEVDSVNLFFTCPKDLLAVSNGHLKNVEVGSNSITYNWAVKNPINNYNIIPYIGKYINIHDTILGKNGVLQVDYWVLNYNYVKAKEHFTEVKIMLHCFEDWFGPYPFYEDGYKLVEAPFLGMEHQSAIAYGNDFKMGYKGRDLSLTGWGLKWDFIIVHESGHEWFGNNISAKDVADDWIHESFTAYSENLYVEYRYGKKAGSEYVVGTRVAILNDVPIIADYNVNRGGSGDVYYKGANMLHIIRQIVNNDSLWKAMLQSLNKTFWHQTVTSKQIEDYMITFLRTDLQKVFDQYLRSTKVPVLEYRFKKGKLYYHWTNCVKDFNMPVKIQAAEKEMMLRAKTKWQKIPYSLTELKVDVNFYVKSQELK